jgi:hypothetical protein
MGKGGVCIFVQKNLKFTNVYIEEYCLDKGIEARYFIWIWILRTNNSNW